MDEIGNTFLLVSDKLMPGIHLKQIGFTYSACGPYTKNKERIKRLKKQETQAIFTKMNLIKHFFKTILHIEILKT